MVLGIVQESNLPGEGSGGLASNLKFVRLALVVLRGGSGNPNVCSGI